MFLHHICQAKLWHTKDKMYFFKQWYIMITKQTSNITKLFPQPQLPQQADVGFHDDAVLHRVRAEAGPLGRHRVPDHAEHPVARTAVKWKTEIQPVNLALFIWLRITQRSLDKTGNPTSEQNDL